jgi:hypothetical protein
MKLALHRIVPAVLAQVRLIEREWRDLIRNRVHPLSHIQPAAPPQFDSGLAKDRRSDPSSEVGSINAT